jgi:solute carrier family 25 oxoglutarate transporter 11
LPPPLARLQPLPLWQKAVCGLTAGGLGALVGSPADLSLIRMQADTTLPPEQRRNYKNAFDALTRIVKDEGMKGLFTGAGPTVVRACALNMGMLASNDQVRCRVLGSGASAPHGSESDALAGLRGQRFQPSRSGVT